MPAPVAMSPALAGDAARALPPIPVLQTRRLQVRPLHAGDRELYLRTYGDPGVMRHVGPPLTAEAAEKGFGIVLRQQSARPARAWYWTLAPHGGDGLAGIGIMALAFDAGRRAAELGLLLASDTQGRGHASEAIGALLDWMLGGNGPDRLWTRHLPGNPAAHGLMQRLRFLPDGERAGYLHWSMDRARWAGVGRRVPGAAAA